MLEQRPNTRLIHSVFLLRNGNNCNAKQINIYCISATLRTLKCIGTGLPWLTVCQYHSGIMRYSYGLHTVFKQLHTQVLILWFIFYIFRLRLSGHWIILPCLLGLNMDFLILPSFLIRRCWLFRTWIMQVQPQSCSKDCQSLWLMWSSFMRLKSM